METFNILQLVVLFIVYELSKYVFGNKYNSFNKKKVMEYLSPKPSLKSTFLREKCEISGLRPLEAEEDELLGSSEHQRTPTGIPGASIISCTARYRIRNHQLHTKAKRTLQF